MRKEISTAVGTVLGSAAALLIFGGGLFGCSCGCLLFGKTCLTLASIFLPMSVPFFIYGELGSVRKTCFMLLCFIPGIVIPIVLCVSFCAACECLYNFMIWCG